MLITETNSVITTSHSNAYLISSDHLKHLLNSQIPDKNVNLPDFFHRSCDLFSISFADQFYFYFLLSIFCFR